MFKRCSSQLLIFVTAVCWLYVPPVRAEQAVLTIDLKDALERARLNSPQFQSSSLAVETARLDRYLAKTAFFPTLEYFNQYIYTQGNGTPSGIFISNDGVHVYNSQAVVHQDLYSPTSLAEYRRSVAAEAVTAAKRDVVLRGLVSTVFRDYYAIVLAQRHSANARRSREEAQRFLDITQKLERGGEVAHADVIKAQLTLEQSEREVQESNLSAEKSKIALAALMFPGVIPAFNVVDNLDSIPALAPFDQLETLAGEMNPDLRVARQVVRVEKAGVSVARSEYYPYVTFDYFFGINNNRFATHDEEGRNSLGSSAQATLNIPVFNWFATRTKVRQAEIRRHQAQLDVDWTLRTLNADLRSAYLEAQTALRQLDLLRRTVDLARESLRLTNLRYEAGEATVFSVASAQSALMQARNDYDNGLARYHLALADIQTLTGNY